MNAKHPQRSLRSRPLIGNFEESVLNHRIDPIRSVEGFTAEVRASCNLIQPSPLRSKVQVYIFSLGDSFPYMGQVDLRARKYKLPKKGTLQVTLFNPNGTLVKLWILKYDLTEMPPSSQTFLRQKTFLIPKLSPISALGNNPQIEIHQNRHPSSGLKVIDNEITDIKTTKSKLGLNSTQNLRQRDRPTGGVTPATIVSNTKRRIKYLIQFNIVSSKSGRIYLNKDLRIFVSKMTDLETAGQFAKQDFELRSFDEMPNNPRYSSR